MLRLACGIVIVAFIFAHSPERPPTAVSQDAARWIDRTRGDITEAVLRSPAAHEILRRSLVSTEKAAVAGER